MTSKNMKTKKTIVANDHFGNGSSFFNERVFLRIRLQQKTMDVITFCNGIKLKQKSLANFS